jgi:transposase
LELSKKSWLLAIQFPDREQPSLYPIAGGDAEKLMAKLTQARDRWAKASGALPMITLCYGVGYDAFWLARFLKARGVECLVIDLRSRRVLLSMDPQRKYCETEVAAQGSETGS